MITDKRRTVTDDQVNSAAGMWKDGLIMGVIAEKLGLTFSYMRFMTGSKRHLFPYRKNNCRRANPIIPEPEIIIEQEPVARPGCVIRITAEGAKVTLPRITFIDGPEPEGRRI